MLHVCTLRVKSQQMVVLIVGVCGCPEIRVFEDAVSLPGPEILPDAAEPQAQISGGDEDERIPL